MTQTLIDTDVFSELSEAMGADFAGELVETFLGDAPTMLAALESAVTDGDGDAYRRAAHSIKSNAQVFGATALGEQARDMELGELTGDSAGLVAALQATYEDTATALRNLVDE